MFSTTSLCPFWSPERLLASPSLTFPPSCLFDQWPQKWGHFFWPLPQTEPGSAPLPGTAAFGPPSRGTPRPGTPVMCFNGWLDSYCSNGLARCHVRILPTCGRWSCRRAEPARDRPVGDAPALAGKGSQRAALACPWALWRRFSYATRLEHQPFPSFDSLSARVRYWLALLTDH